MNANMMNCPVFTDDDENGTCPAIGYQSMTVCVPVTVTPYAKVGATVTRCCGDPVVTSGKDNTCAGTKNGSCHFTLTQTLCISVPVEFGADAALGDIRTDCLGASADGCDGCTEST